jgi:cation transport ATPase
MDDLESQLTPTDSETFREDRRKRLLRNRVMGFLVFIPLWLLSVVPLARESIDGRQGAAVVAVYLAVGALSLGAAAVIRGIYALLRKLRFWSPWVFVIAAVLAIAGYAVQSAGEEVVPVAVSQRGELSMTR